jgi:hypothetical protein
MAKRTGGQRRIRAISKRGKGENRIAMERSRAKSKASGYKAPKKRTGPNTAAKKTISATKAGKSAGPKKAGNYGLLIKNRKANTATKKAAAGRKSAMGGTGSTLKTKAKQKMLNVKGKSKALIRNAKAGKYVMTAAHKKAISDALKKGGGTASTAVASAKSRLKSLFKRKK